MVLISKNEFKKARDCGFKCREPYTRTSHGKKYAVSDDDYIKMMRFIKEKFEIVEYR